MITHQHTCEGCKAKKPSSSWKPIGETVHINGGRAGDTDHSFFQCKDCGTMWIEVKDLGGFGGKGTFYHPLTDKFYWR
jgi:hypothetical protein